jgi:hypothetical protein
MISTGKLAATVAAVGVLAWAGSIAGHWWDLLTAWLMWGSVVLWALIYELRRTEAPKQTHRRIQQSDA